MSLVEFAYNNYHHWSIQMAALEGLYGRCCRSTVGYFETSEVTPYGTKLRYESLNRVCVIQDRLWGTQNRHTKKIILAVGFVP